jgi:PAS domain S-box-containing protein
MSDVFQISKEELIILNSLKETVIIVDVHMNIRFCNSEVSSSLGFEPAELIGKSVQVLFHQSEWEKLLSEVAPEIKNTKDNLVCIHKSGSPINLEVQISKIQNEGELIAWMFYLRDDAHVRRLTGQLAFSLKEMEFANREMLHVNEELENEIHLRRKVEEELRQQKLMLEKLNNDLENIVKMEVEANREKDRMMVIQSRQASMGEILESVAHQWKQPLNTINLLLYELDEKGKQGVPDYGKFREKIEEIYQVVSYMSNTIDDFRNFFIPGREATQFKLAESIRQTSKFLASEFRHSEIELITELDVSIQISGFQNEFTQVLLNLLNNSRDALAEMKRKNPFVRITLKKENQNAIIEIEDNAGGIPLELLPEIFDAYTSTKKDGKGTGLGLYIARSIIEKKFKGSIGAENTEYGARFTISLPVS